MQAEASLPHNVQIPPADFSGSFFTSTPVMAIQGSYAQPPQGGPGQNRPLGHHQQAGYQGHPAVHPGNVIHRMENLPDKQRFQSQFGNPTFGPNMQQQSAERYTSEQPSGFQRSPFSTSGTSQRYPPTMQQPPPDFRPRPPSSNIDHSNRQRP